MDNIGAPPRTMQAKIEGDGSYFEFTKDTRYVVDAEFDPKDTSPLILRPLFEKTVGWELKIEAQRPKGNYIWLKINPALEEGGYRLSVTSNCIIVESSSSQGFVRAQEDLMQLLSNKREEKEEMVWKIPAMEVKEGLVKI